MLADSGYLTLTLSTYRRMMNRSLNLASLWCTQKPGLRDLWSCRVSITLKSNQLPGLELPFRQLLPYIAFFFWRSANHWRILFMGLGVVFAEQVLQALAKQVLDGAVRIGGEVFEASMFARRDDEGQAAFSRSR